MKGSLWRWLEQQQQAYSVLDLGGLLTGLRGVTGWQSCDGLCLQVAW